MFFTTKMIRTYSFGQIVANKSNNFHTSSQRLLEKTVLYDFHCKHGAKIVPFAGFAMPITYGKIGVSASHIHVRSSCGLFDVSHMLQAQITGPSRIQFLESLTVADIKSLKPDNGCLTLFTNDQGGIIDDLIVSSTSKESIYLVSNAGCRHKVLPLLQSALAQHRSQGGDASLLLMDDHSLLALQGPCAANVLQKVCSANLSEVGFMSSVECSVGDSKVCRVTRCGYTGEDGFEISVPNVEAVKLCELLLQDSAVQLAGLGARDTLRLEAGLCLYGNDMTEETTPVEAGLAWTVAKRRRQEGGFPGHQVIMRQLQEGPRVRRVGLTSDGAPLRPPAPVTHNGDIIGQVCSGCPSPSLGRNIAMAYVPAALARPGTQVQVLVRNKPQPSVVTKMPFVPTNYHVL
ncbi:aminomethyltransferase, mitochondrial [Hyalella azteca]|uniref:Aminomethyltransferase n=1 Tax=Hyalella azteca TaxID=294128 RepID=A0A979FXB0_HYAAZ|nr:aminomethyltransferase, mitochondrial [Hyalella azteca]